jgi:FimV-like protein
LVCAGFFAACANLQPHEKRFPEQTWIEVSTDNFTITSNANQERSVEIARSLELFRDVVLKTTNVRNFQSSVPTLVYVFRDGRTFEAFASTTRKNTVGYFVDTPTANYAVIQADALEGAEVAQHEYVHFLLYSSRFGYPRWYNEGLAEFLSTVGVDREWVHLGRPPSKATWLSVDPPLPLADVVTARNLAGWPSDRIMKFYAKSWLLTHYLHFESERHQQLLQFLRLWNSGAPPGEAFEESFGASYQKLDKALRRYTRKTMYARFKRERFETEVDVSVHSLPTAEALSRLGELLLAVGDEESARLSLNLLRQAVAADPNHARSHAGTGTAMVVLKDEGAEAHFERAIELAPQDARVQLVYAGSRAIRAGNDDIDEEEESRLIEEARLHYQRCIAIAARSPACHAGLGLVSARSGQTAAAAQSLEEAHALLPSSTDISLRLGHFYVEAGVEDRAREILEEVLVRGHGDSSAVAARALLERIDAPSTAEPDGEKR